MKEEIIESIYIHTENSGIIFSIKKDGEMYYIEIENEGHMGYSYNTMKIYTNGRGDYGVDVEFLRKLTNMFDKAIEKILVEKLAGVK